MYNAIKAYMWKLKRDNKPNIDHTHHFRPGLHEIDRDHRKIIKSYECAKLHLVK